MTTTTNTTARATFHNQTINQSKIDYLAGVSPQFWSFVPMTILDVQNLTLIDGIHCMDLMQESTSKGSINSEICFKQRYAPVSKCLLVGTIVYADIRRDGSMVYVIDDGTGMMDCVHWSMADTQQDLYQLPCLEDLPPELSLACNNKFEVGDRVRVFAKIDCLAVAKQTDTEGKYIRELQVAIIEPLRDFDEEARHWRRCMDTTPKCIQHWLDLLGPQIQSQVEDRANLPAADDTTAMWRVFGPSCSCKLTYKDDLLYCHCQATQHPSDPSLTFRDALLEHLLACQRTIPKILVFKYKDVKENMLLQGIASTEAKGREGATAVLVNKLFLDTFRALRQDGILHLMNSDTDEYLFITRGKVLEPFLRSQMELTEHLSTSAKNFVRLDGAPRFIGRVHIERLQYIKRCLWAEKSDKIP